jgi:hypothetical protein
MQQMNTEQVSLSNELSAFVAERIARYATECDENRQWLAPYVQKHQVLPLLHGWVETIGIRSDGAIRKFYSDGEPLEYEGVRVVDDVSHFIGALVQGARAYPELCVLIPVTPRNAVTCESCRGIGLFPSKPELVCECGGVGWKVPHNQPLNAIAPKDGAPH